MDKLMLAVAIAAVVVGIAWMAQRRKPDPPTAAGRQFEAPAQLDRTDFVRPDAAWLVVVFSSSSCSTCADVWDKARVLESGEVAVQEVEVTAASDLHSRYGIEAVPITVIADLDGVVVSSFMGPVSATHMWAALAEAREPGTVPPGCGEDHGG